MLVVFCDIFYLHGLTKCRNSINNDSHIPEIGEQYIFRNQIKNIKLHGLYYVKNKMNVEHF